MKQKTNINIGGTICQNDALNNLRILSEEVKGLEGDVIEVGVYKGGSGLLLSSIFKDDTTIFLVDTFNGMPEVNQFDNVHIEGDFYDTSYEAVSELFNGKENVNVIQDTFPSEKTEFLKNKKFKLVHLDVDIYDSYKNSLEFLHPLMVSGGVIVCDDYDAGSCLGAKKAIDEFCGVNGLKIHKNADMQCFIRID